MSSPFTRKKLPSKTIIVKRNQTQQIDFNMDKKTKLKFSQHKKKFVQDVNDNIQPFRQSMIKKSESKSDSESDSLSRKSIIGESSHSSVKSLKTIKSKSSKRQRDNTNIKDYAQGLLQQYQTILEKTENKMQSQKQEIIHQRILDQIAEKATVHNYGEQDQFQESGSERTSDLFNDFDNSQDNNKSKSNSISLQQFNSQNESFTDEDQQSVLPPLLEYNNSLIKPRAPTFQSQINGFSHLSVTEYSESNQGIALDQLAILERQYSRLYAKITLVNGPNFIKIKRLQGLLKYQYFYKNYNDNYPFLSLRKKLFYIFCICKRTSKITLKSMLYQYIITLITISNIIAFIYQNLSDDDDTLDIACYFILWFYVLEISLQILAYGLFRTSYIFMHRIINIALILLYYYHMEYPDDIIDISPLRMLRLLNQFGKVFKGLNNMVEALTEALKYIIESTAIVILFILFFASLGTSLFMGLFNQRCLPATDESVWTFCNQGTCGEGQQCVMTDTTYDIPTNFNNIIYSFGIMLKTVTMDDWSWVMYQTIRTFHPMVWIYYVLIIFVGGFFGFNIPIAMFKTHYSEVQNRQETVYIKQNEQIRITQLKKIGFFDYIIEINKYLQQKNNEFIIDFAQHKSDPNFDMQPRLLLGSMINPHFNESNFTTFKNTIKNVTLKFIFFPKLLKIKEFFNNLNLKQFSSDNQILLKITNFSKSSFLIEKDIDYEFSYMPTSQLDILRQSLFPLFKSTENEKIKFNKKKKFIYKLMNVNNKSHLFKGKIRSSNDFSLNSSKNLQQISQISQEVKKFKAPIKITNRIIKFNTQNVSVQSHSGSNSLSQHTKYIPIKKQNEKKNLTLIAQQEALPFIRYNCGEIEMLINGQYCDYQAISKKINQKILFRDLTNNNRVKDDYINLKKNEQQKRIVKQKHWSGGNVINTTFQTILKFDIIFKSLNQKDVDIWRTNFQGLLIILRKRAYYIINFRFTKLGFDLIILINTFFLAMQGIINRAIIDKVEDIATIFLSTEIILEIFIYQPRRIAKNKHHMIELAIVILSLIEFSLSDYLGVTEQYLRLMRSTKCLLFYRCLSYIQMARIIGAIAQLTYKSYIYLMFLMLFTIFTFGLIGMELYAQKFTEFQQNGYLQSFDDPIKAFMTIFNIMTNDDWFGVYRIGTTVNLELTVVFSFVLVFTLNYFVFGIMMAILLDGFSQYLERESSNEENEFMREKIKQINKLNKQLDSENSEEDSQSESSSLNSSSSSIQQYKEIANNALLQSNTRLRRETFVPENLITSGSIIKEQSKRDFNQERLYHSLQLSNRYKRIDKALELKEKIKQDLRKMKNNTNIEIPKLQIEDQKTVKSIKEQIEYFERQLIKQNPKLYTGNDCLYSFNIFHKSNNFRKKLYLISTSQITKYLIDLVLLSSIIYLILPHEYQQQNIFDVILFILNSIIFIEFFIKSIAYGLFQDKGCYINNAWKIIDIIYIIVYYVEFFHISYKPIFIVIDTFLYLRPMKVLYRIKWVARVTAALSQSLLDIVNVFVVLLLVWLMFAVFSMMLYSDKMGYCDQWTNYDVGYNECIQNQSQWVIHMHNFQNITTALPTLFVISTFDGWGSILWVSQNSRESTYGPHLYFSEAPSYIFYIAFCTIGAMFFLQLFTGVLFINLKANSKEIENQQLTQAQLEFQEISNIIILDHPVKSEPMNSKFNKQLFYFITSRQIDILMFSLLIINCISIMMIYHNANDKYNETINLIHHLCTMIFFIWLLILLYTMGINRFKDNFWRIYSLILILLGLLDFILDFYQHWFNHYINSNQLTPYYQELRLFYLLRNLRIIAIFQGLQNLQRLIRVMSFALPFLLKILFILLIIMFVFAFYGVMLFGHIDNGAVINDLINFSNFWLAMLTLLKCVSGDDFRTIMNDCTSYNPYCSVNSKYCGSPYAQIYFIALMLITNYILLNLFVLAMIEQFETFFNNEENILQTYVENIDGFRKIWFKYSCQKGQLLNIKYVPYVLLEIQKPLGCKFYENLWDAAKYSLNFNLICDLNGNVSYNQLLYEIFYYRYKKQIFGQCSEIALEKMKTYHKIMNFRLAYQRRGLQYRRQNIGPQLQLKGKQNPLMLSLNALLAFKTWLSHTKTLIDNIKTDQQYISERSIKETESIRHTISQRSLQSQEGKQQLLDKPIYQKRRQQKLKRVSLQGKLDDYQPGDVLNVKQLLKRKSSFQISADEGYIQDVRFNIIKKNKK